MLKIGPRFVVSTAGIALAVIFLSTLGTRNPLSATFHPSQANKEARTIRDIPYANTPDNRQTLDLYLPAGSNSPLLLIFIHGGFWTLSDNEFRIGPSLAQALVPSGIAVALVRYRLAPAYRHSSQAEDVAAAVAHLTREGKRYGYDSKRMFLAGHSAGAHLAALVALDPRYLNSYRMSPDSLAGVITISGIYDLKPKPDSTQDQKAAVQQAFGDSPETLKAASPITHVRPGGPPFLILSAAGDLPGFAMDAKRFGDSLRNAGHPGVEQFILPDLDHFSIIQLKDRNQQARDLILEFLKIQPLPPELSLLVEAKRKWRSAPFSTLPFWKHEELIRSYPIDRRFVQRLLPIYGNYRYELLEWPLERYHAIDLFSFLDLLPSEKVGRGHYLTITNIRDEKIFWRRQQIEPYKPVIVIGIDDEKNLFRLGAFYRALREYSWKAGPQPPVMTRPVGAFIHFLKEPPLEFLRQPSHDALTVDSFQLANSDPLAPLSHLPKEIYEVMTSQNGCVYCHSFRGVGSRSHHTKASDGGAHGGFALPLEEYPPSVWKAFVFSQEEAAAKIGASPNPIPEHLRQSLHDWVIKSREDKSQSSR
ncbi:MAG TPA: alpha/beta hydrolase [Candidatus Binatia bacterium]|jgi:acetyl esterase/lipase|nr:alpha/beta hydrolase [Candidatus Binatia bacterium]